jgi:hypothetical protein
MRRAGKSFRKSGLPSNGRLPYDVNERLVQGILYPKIAERMMETYTQGVVNRGKKST